MKNMTWGALFVLTVLVLGYGGGAAGRGGTMQELPLAAQTGWQSAASMSEARGAHVAAMLQDGRVLVTGGRGSGGSLASTEIYDPATDIWAPAAPMHTSREFADAVLLNDGRMLVFGGTTSGPAAEIYDPATDTWFPTGSISACCPGSFAGRLGDGTVLTIAFGFNLTDPPTTELITERYDPSTDTWIRLPSPPMTYFDRAVVLADGRALAIGSRREGSAAAGEVAAIFDPTASVWSPASPIGDGVWWLVTLADGRVLAIVRSTETLGVSALYDPATGQWTPSGEVGDPPIYTRALRLGDDRVLAAGSIASDGSTRLFDPATDMWSPGPVFVGRRNNFSMTLLPNGDVLVAGGADPGGGGILATVERWNPAR
jgi:hypothetical protein